MRCPSLADYLPQLVRYVLDVSRTTIDEPELEDVTDPLD